MIPSIIREFSVALAALWRSRFSDHGLFNFTKGVAHEVLILTGRVVAPPRGRNIAWWQSRTHPRPLVHPHILRGAFSRREGDRPTSTSIPSGRIFGGSYNGTAASHFWSTSWQRMASSFVRKMRCRMPVVRTLTARSAAEASQRLGDPQRWSR